MMNLKHNQSPDEHPDFHDQSAHFDSCAVVKQGADDGGSDCECFYEEEE